MRKCFCLLLLLVSGCGNIPRSTEPAVWDIHFQKGQYDLAIKEINRQIETHPGHPLLYIPYNDRGEAYRRKGDLDLSIADYNKALEINPTYSTAYNNRGLAYTRKGEYDRAIADFNKALDIDHKFAKAYANRASAYYHKGEYDKAWSDVYQARALGQHMSDEFLTLLRRASEPAR
jgi:tetratricopeptide (TPR) repeat protein